MKILNTFIFLFLAFCAFSQPLDVRATITTQGLTFSVNVMNSSPVTFPFALNVVAMNIAVSLPANGASDPSLAPPISDIQVFDPGLAINTSIQPFIADDRFVYTIIATGNVGMLSTWPAGSENNVLTARFETAAGLYPRLDNRIENTLQSYFYFEVGGIQRSDTEVMPFYNGSQGNYTGIETYVESLTPLPITLHTFSAQKYSDRSAKLNWVTSKEINSSHFGIERSADGLTDWTKLGEVKAAGNSNYHVNYNFIDNTIPSTRNNDQVYYYRLQMTDLDGAFKYSDVRGVNFGSSLAEEIKLYPNPTIDKINIDLSALDFSEKVATMNVYDFHGKLVSTKEVNGAGIELLDMQNLQSGMYNVIIQHNNDTFTYKVVKVD